MIDIAVLVQVSWSFIWLSRKSLQNALLYAGGFVSAGYVAWQTTGWVSQWMALPSNPAFLWIEQHMTSGAQAVAILTKFLPPQPVTTAMSQSRFISLHVARTLMFCMITIAVFITFSVIAQLKSVIWDKGFASPVTSAQSTGLTYVVALVCSLYGAFIGLMLISNIAWLQPFHSLAPYIHASLALHWYAILLHYVHR